MISVDLAAKRRFTTEEARAIATELGIDFGALGRDLGRWGLMSELEHGPRETETDVSSDDPVVTGNIALAHPTEFPDHHTRLAILEREVAHHLHANTSRGEVLGNPCELRDSSQKGAGPSGEGRVASE